MIKKNINKLEKSYNKKINNFYDSTEINKPDIKTSTLSNKELKRFTNDLIVAFKTVYDPEIPVDIYELGLIYKVDINDKYKINILMTLTAPGCPVAEEIVNCVKNAVCNIEGVCEVEVKLIFDPPWTPKRMSDEAKIALNMF